jgi:hypothetical protein
VEDHQLGDTRTSCYCQPCTHRCQWLHTPAPNTRAVLDSFLYSPAEDTMGGDIVIENENLDD